MSRCVDEVKSRSRLEAKSWLDRSSRYCLFGLFLGQTRLRTMSARSPPRSKAAQAVKRVDTITLDDSDDEGPHASTSTPATSIDTPRDDKETKKADERAEESTDVEIVEPVRHSPSIRSPARCHFAQK